MHARGGVAQGRAPPNRCHSNRIFTGVSHVITAWVRQRWGGVAGGWGRAWRGPRLWCHSVVGWGVECVVRADVPFVGDWCSLDNGKARHHLRSEFQARSAVC